MKSGSVKVLSVLILILAIIIGGYLTFSLVLTSIGIEIISMGVFVFFILQALAAIMENLENINIIFIDFMDLEFEEIKEYHALHKYAEAHYKKGKTNYLFVDEVQMCPKFELAINSLYSKGKYDIYILLSLLQTYF